MVTPALIDLNILALKHLDRAYFALYHQDYDACTASLHSVNAALKDGYRVEFNTDKYRAATEHPTLIYCKPCGTKFNKDDIKMWNMLLPLAQQIGSGSTHTKVWTCHECKATNILSESKIEKQILEEPFFLKIVPYPPSRKQNLSDRTTYHIKYKAWFGMAVSELTRQISQLRWDNHRPGDEQGMDQIQEQILATLDSKY
uniref:ORF14 n=1 Tax=Nitrosopumilaceae spindle-shaped virus TaxID=3065433 RepID=A0AAT9J762_9VIRU